jgi:hypothetical protein
MSVSIRLGPEGVIYSAPAGSGDWRVDETTSAADAEVVSFAAQLEELGYAEPRGNELVLSWQGVYRVLEQEDFAPSARALPVPPIDSSIAPALRSTRTLSDPSFQIAISGWHRVGSGKFADQLSTTGPVVHANAGHDARTLTERRYLLLEAVRGFQRRRPEDSTPDGNRLGWGEIRNLAMDADAVLDDFLRNTVVLRPRMLGLGMERIHVGDEVAVRLEPTFPGAPGRWIETFDKARRLASLYKVVEPDGGYHEIVVDDQVRAVLAEIKRMPGRTVAGPRARRFMENPFAFFEGSGDGIFDEAQIEGELERLRDAAWTFRPQVDLGESGEVAHAGVALQRIGDDAAPETQVRLFSAPEGLETFVRLAGQARLDGQAFFAWSGLDVELGANAAEYLAQLAEILQAWQERTPLAVAGASDDYESPDQREAEGPSGKFVIDASLVLDVSRYHDRVDAIGIETPYGIISIPLGPKGAWLPEEQELRLLIADGPDGGAAAASLNREELSGFVTSVKEAVADGRPRVDLPRGGSMDTSQARDFVDALPRALVDEATPEQDRATAGREAPRPRTGLLIKPNIDGEDYVTRRTIELRPPDGAAPLLPTSLKSGVALKAHQLQGVLWLQHLFTSSPTRCRGALLADDMGLGKTLQALALIARAREDDPDLPPALVVAPVTLLENWSQEVARFFKADSLPLLTLYGEDLRSFRVKGTDIDEKLRSEGLKKFLRPGWQEGSAIVLTTYETLRDYEFSFGDVRWSIVVCDEAQRIKNPNALVSRAAKKLKARFCVAATGTPVENNLTDLWSLFDFIQPGLLEPLNRFNRNYRRPIEAKTEAERERVDELRRIIDPQILRRTKADVARDLPKKVFDDDCRQLGMSPRQQELYSTAINAQQAAQNVASTGTEILQLISVLRRICTDPRSGHELHEPLPPLHAYRAIAPKLDWLLTTLEEIRQLDEKAIIFLDRKDIQRLVQAYVRDHFGFAPEIINGETPTGAGSQSRQRRIDRFQAQGGFGALILSPVAAGVGLNIQKANHVIHYMRHWNPAKEDQATDRAYRIGQDRDVTVYTPIVIGNGWTSFDERLDELLEKKRGIAANMLNGADDVGAAEFADLVT